MENYGFLRNERMLASEDDVYVSQTLIRRYGLRSGDYVLGPVRAPRGTEKYPGLQGAARSFRQFLRRGLHAVQAEWSLICTAPNPLKLSQAWQAA